jgi:hypothetical protein
MLHVDKIINDIRWLDTNSFFLADQSGTRGHSVKLVKGRGRYKLPWPIEECPDQSFQLFSMSYCRHHNTEKSLFRCYHQQISRGDRRNVETYTAQLHSRGC